MKQRHERGLAGVLRTVIGRSKLLTAAIVMAVVGAVVTALLPPLVLERAVNLLTAGNNIPFALALLYVALTFLTGLLDATRESLLIVFGQKITHGLRSALCSKLSRLPSDAFVKQDPGAAVSRFVGDVDTVEALFTSGIISMVADGGKVISILAILFVKNRGLALVLLVLTPLLFLFTRQVQKRMLAAQLANRVAVERATNHVPETIRCIRTIHALHKEQYMCKAYERHIQDSYDAVEKANFYDAVYSPVILIASALTVAAVMLLSAAGIPAVQSFFGMSVGTAAAVIVYIGSVFAPLESVGMEIQTIQSAVAGVRRIDEFLAADERWETDASITLDSLLREDVPCVELRDVTFGYDEGAPVLRDLSFVVRDGEQATLTGRTGAGKSTVFKLLLGQYNPAHGQVLIYGREASQLPDTVKRRLFGYVEQSFRLVPGTVLDQITLFDESISRAAAERAAVTVGLHEAISALEQGYDTPCGPSLFSQGQWQLLSIARAIAAEPKLLLLDEMTANLDADTEQTVLTALKNAAEHRTVLSISHRLYQQTGGRQISI
ncbi:ABC-type multidrug transport system, ATPase and permease component [Oscillibacter sp. PC13]|uniref:ABC transporter ATP-binding protein n=1 Tax=Oscillibacter sp. PC13 TaxID=1855299 RepID=UPI0008F13DB4|nr:ABC transporter ATP-binding protein [Oscillibacter sp. PC13]SFP19783.1 ABC-type multidrug transport system, ATPase and permease component [Oscillibacter sp. PC13]